MKNKIIGLSILFVLSVLSTSAFDAESYNNDILYIKSDLSEKIKNRNINYKIENSEENKKESNIKHLPWSFTEKRIEYDFMGHSQYLPYNINDINIQY